MIYLLCALILAISLVARLAEHIPALKGTAVHDISQQIYDYVRDMSLFLVTMAAAYLADVFQRRAKFIESLEEEWRAMVKTKTDLVMFCERDDTTLNDYLHAYGRMSTTLDNMRIVYRNVGETDQLIGLYPYSPLHDMRRALETLDPRRDGVISSEQRRTVRAAIQQSFTGLRETFLEELDLEEPTHGQLVSGAKRVKKPGSTRRAKAQQRRQQRRLVKRANGADDEAVTVMLAEAYVREQMREAAGR